MIIQIIIFGNVEAIDTIGHLLRTHPTITVHIVFILIEIAVDE